MLRMKFEKMTISLVEGDKCGMARFGSPTGKSTSVEIYKKQVEKSTVTPALCAKRTDLLQANPVIWHLDNIRLQVACKQKFKKEKPFIS